MLINFLNNFGENFGLDPIEKILISIAILITNSILSIEKISMIINLIINQALFFLHVTNYARI